MVGAGDEDTGWRVLPTHHSRTLPVRIADVNTTSIGAFSHVPSWRKELTNIGYRLRRFL